MADLDEVIHLGVKMIEPSASDVDKIYKKIERQFRTRKGLVKIDVSNTALTKLRSSIRSALSGIKIQVLIDLAELDRNINTAQRMLDKAFGSNAGYAIDIKINAPGAAELNKLIASTKASSSRSVDIPAGTSAKGAKTRDLAAEKRKDVQSVVASNRALHARMSPATPGSLLPSNAALPWFPNKANFMGPIRPIPGLNNVLNPLTNGPFDFTGLGPSSMKYGGGVSGVGGYGVGPLRGSPPLSQNLMPKQYRAQQPVMSAGYEGYMPQRPRGMYRYGYGDMNPQISRSVVNPKGTPYSRRTKYKQTPNQQRINRAYGKVRKVGVAWGRWAAGPSGSGIASGKMNGLSNLLPGRYHIGAMAGSALAIETLVRRGGGMLWDGLVQPAVDRDEAIRGTHAVLSSLGFKPKDDRKNLYDVAQSVTAKIDRTAPGFGLDPSQAAALYKDVVLAFPKASALESVDLLNAMSLARSMFSPETPAAAFVADWKQSILGKIESGSGDTKNTFQLLSIFGKQLNGGKGMTREEVNALSSSGRSDVLQQILYMVAKEADKVRDSFSNLVGSAKSLTTSLITIPFGTALMNAGPAGMLKTFRDYYDPGVNIATKQMQLNATTDPIERMKIERDIRVEKRKYAERRAKVTAISTKAGNFVGGLFSRGGKSGRFLRGAGIGGLGSLAFGGMALTGIFSLLGGAAGAVVGGAAGPAGAAAGGATGAAAGGLAGALLSIIAGIGGVMAGALAGLFNSDQWNTLWESLLRLLGKLSGSFLIILESIHVLMPSLLRLAGMFATMTEVAMDMFGTLAVYISAVAHNLAGKTNLAFQTADTFIQGGKGSNAKAAGMAASLFFNTFAVGGYGVLNQESLILLNKGNGRKADFSFDILKEVDALLKGESEEGKPETPKTHTVIHGDVYVTMRPELNDEPRRVVGAIVEGISEIRQYMHESTSVTFGDDE